MDGDASAAAKAVNSDQPMDGRASNALRHGLTAQKVLPSDLAATASDFRAALRSELAPSSTLDRILVDELSRHAAAMQHGADYEAAVLRATKKQTESLDALTGVASDADEQIAAMMTSHSLECVTRYRRQHERAFHAALARLRDSPPTPHVEITQFESEGNCRKWLWDWQHEQSWQCPQCQGSSRCWLTARGCWECGCSRQFSLRHGTIYAASRIPLATWFAAVIALVTTRGLSTSELAGTINLSRRATVAKMASRIRDALESSEASTALAGLNDFVHAHLRQMALKKSPAQSKTPGAASPRQARQRAACPRKQGSSPQGSGG